MAFENRIKKFSIDSTIAISRNINRQSFLQSISYHLSQNIDAVKHETPDSK